MNTSKPRSQHTEQKRTQVKAKSISNKNNETTSATHTKSKTKTAPSPRRDNIKEKKLEDIKPKNITEANTTVKQGQLQLNQKLSSKDVSINCEDNEEVLEIKEINTFQLDKGCYRLCYYKGQLWFPCWNDVCIYVTTLDGKFVRNIPLQDTDKPRALHPLDSRILLIATDNGLFLFDTKTDTIADTICKCKVYDVHVHDGKICYLYSVDNAETHVIHVCKATSPHKEIWAKVLNHPDARRVLVADNNVSVSYVLGNTGVSQYLFEKDTWPLNWGKEGDSLPGELYYPFLCGIDQVSGYMMLADCHNHRLQMVSIDGEWTVIPDMHIRFPVDIVFHSNYMWVLHGLGKKCVIKYEMVKT